MSNTCFRKHSEKYASAVSKITILRAKMEPGTSKKRPGRSSGSLSGAGVDLGLIFIDFLLVFERLLD